MQTAVWWRRRWIRATETVCARVAIASTGFAIMIFGLWLAAPSPDVMMPGLTMIVLPIGLFIGSVGAVIFLVALAAHVRRKL
jgi:tellurite resistance protein TehA-like permease